MKWTAYYYAADREDVKVVTREIKAGSRSEAFEKAEALLDTEDAILEELDCSRREFLNWMLFQAPVSQPVTSAASPQPWELEGNPPGPAQSGGG